MLYVCMRIGGSGLGLWISRHIVQMHKVRVVEIIILFVKPISCTVLLFQGFMSVTSAGRGHGSTFFFELPVFGPDYSPPQPTAQATTQSQSHEQHPKQQLPRPKPANLEARPRLLSPSSVACDDEIEDLQDGFTTQNDSLGGSQIFPAFPSAAFGPDSVEEMQEGDFLRDAK